MLFLYYVYTYVDLIPQQSSMPTKLHKDAVHTHLKAKDAHIQVHHAHKNMAIQHEFYATVLRTPLTVHATRLQRNTGRKLRISPGRLTLL